MDALATVRSYDELIDALRARLVELDITHATLDQISGLHTGYAAKILGAAQVRRLGPVSFGLLLQSLALKLIVVQDDDAAAKMADRWEKRRRADYNAERSAKLGERTINRLFPAIARELGRRGGKTFFANMTPAQVRKHQRRAGRARWLAVKAGKRAPRASPKRAAAPPANPGEAQS